MRYFLIGFMGSGKTYWGKQWSNAFDLPLVDLDEEIEKQEGKSVRSIFEEKGEIGFRKIERKVLLQFFKKDNFIMSCGGGTPCFYDNMRSMNRYGVTIYLKSSPEALADRLRGEKSTRPLIKDAADDVLVSFIAQKLDARKEDYAKSIYHLETKFLTNDNFERILRRHGS